jgi:hypothetical protein
MGAEEATGNSEDFAICTVLLLCYTIDVEQIRLAPPQWQCSLRGPVGDSIVCPIPNSVVVNPACAFPRKAQRR